jgi:hypothetical protein
MTDDSQIKNLIERWSHERIPAPPGASDVELLTLETGFGLRLPKSFRTYLQQANGMANGACSGNLVHFWTLDEIRQHLNEPGTVQRLPFLPFADYSFDCWAWVLPIDPSGDVRDAVFTYGPPLEPCAQDFLSFVARYLEGDDLAPKRLASPVRLSWKTP